ncbi:MAG: zinc-binding dehydrogenase [Ignavibacteriales bacterium]|nr:zinc-binding dehydrogenase [Ignavibacteriales bacterium]
MKAIVKPTPLPDKDWGKGLQLIDRDEPQIIKPTDVKLQVLYGAICGTDVGIYHSKDSLRRQMSVVKTRNVIIGHEFCGKIIGTGKRATSFLLKKVQIEYGKEKFVRDFFLQLSKVKAKEKDARFVQFLEKEFYSSAEMHITDNTCYQCKLGEQHVCQNTVIKGVHDDGAFTQYVVVPVENIILFRKGEIPPEIIAFMDALGNATHTIQSVPVKGKTVVVLGCGVQGLMATAVAKMCGAKKIFVSDFSHGDFTHEKLVKKRFRLAKAYGATECFDVASPEERIKLYETVRKVTNNAGADAVLEMSGSYKAYEDAFQIVRNGGAISLLGLPFGKMEIDFAKDIIFKGVTIHGIIGRRVFSSWDLMRTLLKKGLAKKFMQTGFITHQFPIEKFEDAFAAIENGDALKVLLKP